ncbi:hypothetical protein GPJ56_002277 [Histomonas meleagridis]|uniref:uncharacterized protein n=1 Tax=Histomonas meleagridis TaxID=135588 RepID=UPI0035594F44|nr:hypothetical protein GPJ56_002277 [Histomonas meleagridis]KAH0802969.1 hypothetical protein GO595_004476 [Histomonas meleagridis]
MKENKNPGITLTETGAGYDITQIGNFEYSDYLEGYHRDRIKRPKELSIRMVLPGVLDPGTIDIQVFEKEVKVKCRKSENSSVFIHDFSIPLPYEVMTNTDYSASWSQMVLTLKVRVKPEKIERKPFHIENKEPSDDEQEVPQSVIKEAVRMNEDSPSTVNNVKELKPKIAKFNLTQEEKVITVSLYVPRAQEETLIVENNHISVHTKDGQIYEANLNLPFTLRSKPIIKANPVTLYLIFIENDEESENESTEESQTPEETTDEIKLKNPFIYELEP